MPAAATRSQAACPAQSRKLHQRVRTPAGLLERPIDTPPIGTPKLLSLAGEGALQPRLVLVGRLLKSVHSSQSATSPATRSALVACAIACCASFLWDQIHRSMAAEGAGQFRVFADAAAMAGPLGAYVTTKAAEAIAARGKFVVAVSGGSLPKVRTILARLEEPRACKARPVVAPCLLIALAWLETCRFAEFGSRACGCQRRRGAR